MHFYFGFESTLALTPLQKSKVDAALDTLGDMVNEMPHLRIAIRDRLDGQAWIVEISVPSITKSQVVNALASALGITVNQINNNSNYIVFGSPNNWDDSRLACLAYIDANRAAWEVAS